MNKLKKVHEVEIEILDKIVDICEKNNINYFLDFGALLGAVRHKGFIPWDDDIDIGMLRDDYEKFIDLCINHNALGSKYFLHCSQSDKKYFIPFIKVKKNNTTFAEKNLENINTHKGIFVDIFPYDNVQKQNSKLQKIQAILVKSMQDAAYVKMKIYKLNSVRRKLLVILFLPFSLKSLNKKYTRISKWFNKKQTEYIVNFCGDHDINRDTFIKSKIFPLKKVMFECKKYNGVNDTDYYLSKLYGDYMTLPKKEDRKCHMPTYISFTEGENKINEN